MSYDDHYIERLIPSEIDRSDPNQLDLLQHSEHQYRVASFHVENKRVLDIGCGVGYGAGILATIGHAAHILGIDADPYCIEIAKRDFANERISYRCCHYAELDIATPFDAIVCLNMIEHLYDPAAPILFARKHIVRGGDLIISTWVTPTSDFNPTHHCDFSPASFRKSVRKAGFEVQNEFLIRKAFQPKRVVRMAKNKKLPDDAGTRPRSLIRYYWSNPYKAWLRACSLLRDGFVLKNLLLHAKAA
jgi:2-polyprenyl-3-methyl-5-hydroxy-6-metoxy-1,4-benzoquinol methylase